MGATLRCQNCGYTWDYGGNADYYTSCPRCSYRVNVKTQQV